MTALAADLTAEAGIMTLDGVLDVGSYQAPYTIDSENVLVTGGDNSTTPSIIRGANGTAPATHSAGATVTSGWGGGGVANPLTADLDAGGFGITNTAAAGVMFYGSDDPAGQASLPDAPPVPAVTTPASATTEEVATALNTLSLQVTNLTAFVHNVASILHDALGIPYDGD